MKRSVPIFIPQRMTVRYAYGSAPIYQIAEQAQPVSAPVVDVTPREVDPGWWVIQWDGDVVTVEPATGAEIERWKP